MSALIEGAVSARARDEFSMTMTNTCAAACDVVGGTSLTGVWSGVALGVCAGAAFGVLEAPPLGVGDDATGAPHPRSRSATIVMSPMRGMETF